MTAGAGGYGLDHLPYARVRMPDGPTRAVTRYQDALLDLALVDAELFGAGTLDAFLAAGRQTWTQVRLAAIDRITADDHALLPLAGAVPVLGFTVADYVDFYASEVHATNAGRIFRPDGEALTPNWKHLPIGYHGRAGSVVVSGTEVRRPSGQRKDADGELGFGPARRLDFEAELGFVVGTASEPGAPVPVTELAEHVFGVCLLNDWSARDIQAWESQPLGPFLGKSFATSVSGWLTPLDALGAAWTAPPRRDPTPLPYLDDSASAAGLDLELTVCLNGTVLSRPRFDSMYWTPAQLLAHLTSNGSYVRTGDVLGSGTVSSAPGDFGSLLELGWNGRVPIQLDDATTRTWLQDGDEVLMTASAPAPGGRIELGEVRGRIVGG